MLSVCEISMLLKIFEAGWMDERRGGVLLLAGEEDSRALWVAICGFARMTWIAQGTALRVGDRCLCRLLVVIIRRRGS